MAAAASRSTRAVMAAATPSPAAGLLEAAPSDGTAGASPHKVGHARACTKESLTSADEPAASCSRHAVVPASDVPASWADHR